MRYIAKLLPCILYRSTIYICAAAAKPPCPHDTSIGMGSQVLPHKRARGRKSMRAVVLARTEPVCRDLEAPAESDRSPRRRTSGVVGYCFSECFFRSPSHMLRRHFVVSKPYRITIHLNRGGRCSFAFCAMAFLGIQVGQFHLRRMPSPLTRPAHRAPLRSLKRRIWS